MRYFKKLKSTLELNNLQLISILFMITIIIIFVLTY